MCPAESGCLDIIEPDSVLKTLSELLLMDSVPLSRVVNSQPAGIGRIVSLGSRCAWNNLGRNVVFADASLRPIAIFGDTMFPEDDEASQFDLDIHAIVELADTGQIAVVNHLGVVRIFEPPRSIGSEPVVGPHLDETRRLDFVDDVERVIGLGDRLVTSRPRGRAPGWSAGDPADRLLTPVPRREHRTRVLRLRHRSRGELDAGWHRLGRPRR